MFSALTTYLFGEETNGESPDTPLDQLDFTSVEEVTDLEGDWILVGNSSCTEGATNPSAAEEIQRFTDPVATTTVALEESWFVTPPTCFGGREAAVASSQENQVFENLLIEHPSMSVYGPRPIAGRCSRRRHNKLKHKIGSSPTTSRTAGSAEGPTQGRVTTAEPGSVTVVIPNHNNHIEVNRLAAKLTLLESRKPLNQLNCNSAAFALTRKGIKRENLVHVHQSSRKRNKQQSRKAGKHAGVAGKRGT